MVHHHNEHWGHIDPAPSTALQWKLAPNHFRHFLRPKPHLLPPLHLYILPAIRFSIRKSFPAVLRHPHQSLFLATFPVGLANAHKHDCLGVRASVRSRHGYVCMGIMVD